MVTNQCPIYGRFCTRKRSSESPVSLRRGIDRAYRSHLREHQEVRDVILSGGDPLLLPDHLLERILKALRTIPHLELIRIGSRVPGTLPERITPKLCEIIKKYHPLYMNLHQPSGRADAGRKAGVRHAGRRRSPGGANCATQRS
ncbi:MAG: hypothetical protein U0231_02425 [Nitrospiraceae bacterium]